MEDPADGSSQDRPGWHLLDECVSTRNRKVEGSNPSSGSQRFRSAAWSTCFAWSFLPARWPLSSGPTTILWVLHPAAEPARSASAPDWMQESLLPGGGRRDGRAL